MVSAGLVPGAGSSSLRASSQLSSVPSSTTSSPITRSHPAPQNGSPPTSKNTSSSASAKNAYSADSPNFSMPEIIAALKVPKIYFFTACQFLNIAGYGLSWQLPTITTSLGFAGLPQNQLVNIPPAAATVIGIIHRRPHHALRDHHPPGLLPAAQRHNPNLLHCDDGGL
ncbi:hypothetical protein BJX70DRAFT_366312 [Aspergillus crustosus]